MTNHKKGMIFSAISMLLALILLCYTIINNQSFKFENILSFGGLFLGGLYMFLLNLKKSRNN